MSKTLVERTRNSQLSSSGCAATSNPAIALVMRGFKFLRHVEDALEEVIKAGMNTTSAADSALANAEIELKAYSNEVHSSEVTVGVAAKLAEARAEDESSTRKFRKVIKEKLGFAPGAGLHRGSTKNLNFVLLRESLHERDLSKLTTVPRFGQPCCCRRDPVEFQPLQRQKPDYSQTKPSLLHETPIGSDRLRPRVRA
ncbi:hypothetical protein BC834DRAFT_301177 [Gloeopeniophorella convolvens]|nr:hypothetical protein BC834DRAFT_301177 [Gloeopeniophorella convolvens]